MNRIQYVFSQRRIRNVCIEYSQDIQIVSKIERQHLWMRPLSGVSPFLGRNNFTVGHNATTT